MSRRGRRLGSVQGGGVLFRDVWRSMEVVSTEN